MMAVLQVEQVRSATAMERLIATMIVARSRERGIDDVELLERFAVEPAHVTADAEFEMLLGIIGVRVDTVQVKLEVRRLLTN